ncbi:MAG TPA: 50S ribosomal protein L25/general stress protein Ctc [Bryobacteraceae bacterium]|nr:50S ribosomal protein L25/general stress protein Ctc [Bryobacteraceae bacterium]
MRKEWTVSAQPRPARGKNEARRLRARGLIPAVVYGGGREPVAVSVSPKEILKILHSETGHNTIFSLAVNGDTTPVMIVDWQFHPVTETLLHVDFKRIDLTRRIRVSVPVHTVGEAKGVKQQGGLLEIVTRELEIECLPDEIPDHLSVDVTDLMIGQSRRASDVPLSGSMVLLSHPETVVAHVIALRHHEAAPAAEAPAAAAPSEPEVIKKGKKEEAGEE